MSLIRNSILIQNKSMGEQISFMEWNRVVNQLSTQANMLTNATENIIENYFDFVWLPNNGTPIPNGIDIIVIPDNSLGDLVTDEETLANYFNKEDSQYPSTEWKYRIIKYKRGTRVLEIISTGVMKFSQDELEDLINSRLKDTISNVIGEEVELYVNTLPLKSLRTIDGVETKPFDLVLVGELGESNGVYSVQEGEWVKVSDVYPNQVFSIYNGNLYGGSMLKLLENNNITKVRSENDVIVSDLEPVKPRINMMWYQLLED